MTTPNREGVDETMLVYCDASRKAMVSDELFL
jgi:hypothetical protein